MVWIIVTFEKNKWLQLSQATKTDLFCPNLRDNSIHVFLTVLENFDDGFLHVCCLGKRGDEATEDRWGLDENCNDDKESNYETQKEWMLQKSQWHARLTGTAASTNIWFISDASAGSFTVTGRIASLNSGWKVTNQSQSNNGTYIETKLR